MEWQRASPATLPTFFELRQDYLFPIPQLHSGNFDYLRAPHMNVGVFISPHLSTALTIPSNPQPLLASQLAAQFTAFDRHMGYDLNGPLPQMRGRSRVRGNSAVRDVSAARTPGAGSSTDDFFRLS